MKKYLLIFLKILIALSIHAQSYKYTSSNLNYRNGPGTSYKVLTTIPIGTKVKMAEDCACDWIKVHYNGTIGYVSSKYLTDKRTTYSNKPTSSVKYYTNSAGERIQSPTHYKKPPSGATALCRDGTYSFSRSRRGTCSHHGGVARWLY